MQTLKTPLIIFTVVTGLIVLLFYDNIRGYYRFKAICEKEGGLRVYQKLEPGVGWMADSEYYARSAALLKNVGFARYTNPTTHISYDIRYLKGNPGNDASFDKRPADLALPVLYAWERVSVQIQGELRLKRFGYEITDLQKQQLVARIYEFSYSQFNQDKTLLAAPSLRFCASDDIWASENEAKLFKN
ncbi:hypothetical protein [Chitinibacter tainanensis]|uniref:hypothetical protein n=1 Tax=Chitinibacter tainanensis TaxID=230667 RepID=UPI00048F8B2B|nr:hypothetical protein [Chitinibacter tainanensis]